MDHLLKHIFWFLFVTIFNIGYATQVNLKSSNIPDNLKQKNVVIKVNKFSAADDPPVVDFTFTNNNECSGTQIQFTSNVSEKGHLHITGNLEMAMFQLVKIQHMFILL